MKILELPDFRDIQSMDSALLAAIVALMTIGIVFVASSSIDFAAAVYGDPWFFARKQSIFLLMGITGGALVFSVPLAIWEKYAGLLLLLGLALLAAVLVPGIGKVVNGSRRWLMLGPIGMQASEIAKFCLIIYFASYLARKNHELRFAWSGFFKIVVIMAMAALLLLMEPDFGSCVVLGVTVGGMMFLAGVPLVRFLGLAALAAGMLALFIKFDPVRSERLLAFMDPWSRQYDSGYQLVQSLIAFGRGEWFGLGLGNSIQKLFFLPEAHTDFVFAIVAEETGLIGAILLISLYAFFIGKMLGLSRQLAEKEKLFGSYAVFGIAVLFAIQAFINMGVAGGLLPTKGLTLPFISYGGSSLLISCALLAIVLRANWELQRVTTVVEKQDKVSRKSRS